MTKVNKVSLVSLTPFVKLSSHVDRKLLLYTDKPRFTKNIGRRAEKLGPEYSKQYTLKYYYKTITSVSIPR